MPAPRFGKNLLLLSKHGALSPVFSCQSYARYWPSSVRVHRQVLSGCLFPQDELWEACATKLFNSSSKYAALQSECPTRLRKWFGAASMKEVYKVLRAGSHFAFACIKHPERPSLQSISILLFLKGLVLPLTLAGRVCRALSCWAVGQRACGARSTAVPEASFCMDATPLLPPLLFFTKELVLTLSRIGGVLFRALCSFIEQAGKLPVGRMSV